MLTLPDLSLPPEVMLQAACGLEEPLVVLERHLGDPEKAAALLRTPAFAKQLEQKQADLLAGGYTTKLKAALYTHDLLDDLYLRAKSSSTATGAVIDIAKTMAKIGDLEPKNTVATPVGAGFSIQIVLPGQQNPINISASPTENTYESVAHIVEETLGNTVDEDLLGLDKDF